MKYSRRDETAPTAYAQFAERINRRPGTLLTATVRFDYHVERLQQQIAEQGITTATHEKMDWVAYNMRRSIDQAYQPGSIEYVDIFRLASHLESLEQRIKAPYAFSDKSQYDLRRQLIDGQYGINARIIESALHIYDSEPDDDIQQAYLRGVINEQTVIALINRDQSPSHLAFSSSATDDHVYKSDVDYWCHTKHAGGQKLNIQVKSSIPPLFTPRTIDNTTYIYASDFDNRLTNSVPLPTSRRIVQEVHGVIDDHSQAQLDKTHKRLMHRLSESSRRIAADDQRPHNT